METTEAITIDYEDEDEDEKIQLTEKQIQALDLLVTGKTKTEAAKEIGVTRETVSRWANGDPIFIAALNSMRQELHEVQADRMRQLAAEAYSALSELMGAEAPPSVRLRAALAVIEAAKDVEKRIGPTEPEDVTRRLISRSRINEGLAEMTYLLAKMSQLSNSPEQEDAQLRQIPERRRIASE